MDLTAHVLLAACAAAAVADAGTTLRQREALRRLGLSAGRPAYAGDPQSYLRALATTGEAAELLDPSGLGGFDWLVQTKGCPDPLAAE
jgi:SAM-dependent MidA family methyltransferase